MPPAHAFTARPNVLLICVDDLRPELNCFGVDYIHSPNIDQLAARGVIFKQHYVQAPTCGASRCALLTGLYGAASNNALFNRATNLSKSADVPPSLPAYFRKQGYTTVSVGKVSHHPGGRGGPDWNNPKQLEMPESWDRHLLPAGAWQHPRGWMHGLANGEIRKNAKDMDVFQSAPGDDDLYPDGPSTDEALRQLQQLAQAEEPFFLAFGVLRPHLPFGAPAKYMKWYQDVELPPVPHPDKPSGKTTWHASGEFMKYNRWGRNPNDDRDFANEVRRHYAACVSYADAQVGRIMKRLDELQLADNTIIVLWGDHGWHLGEHSIWGKHSLFDESLRSPLIVCRPRQKSGQVCEAIVESIDVFPTLCELADLPLPEFLAGGSLVPYLDGNETEDQAAVSYFRNATTLRSERFRFILHKDGHQELYDHQSPAGEQENVADSYPEQIELLTKELNDRLANGRG